MTNTIFAVSSGAPPAAIAVMRVSGPEAARVAAALGKSVPEPRRATLRWLRDGHGVALDQALMLWFPGPNTATGEDLLELHLHGGRAVVAAVEGAIADVPGTRRAEAGEFTRRALLNGRIDLTQAVGLADLLQAETETQRRAAMAMSEGAFGRELRDWMDRLSDLRAMVEATLDYDEEGDVAESGDRVVVALEQLGRELTKRLEAPTSERVSEGLRVVIAGPPNAGKSSLLNAMLDDDIAIVSPVSGTTRDRIEARVIRGGQLYTLVDTAGLAERTDDPIEQEGIRRSGLAIASADLLLWLADDPPPVGTTPSVWVHSRSDVDGRGGDGAWEIMVSVKCRSTIDRLWMLVEAMSGDLLRSDEPYLLQASQQSVIVSVREEIALATQASDPLLIAEHLRRATGQLAALLGIDQVEAMLDALFARFCVGK